jgi:acetyl-CoA acetyltransferase
MASNSLMDRTAIVGIGWTEFSKASGRPVLDLAAEASLRALDDAGLKPAVIDGLVTSSWNFDSVAPDPLAHALGITDCHFQLFDCGGGRTTCAVVGAAAAAVHAGLCDYALVYRAGNDRSERQSATRVRRLHDEWYGEMHAAIVFGPHVTAYMARYGTTSIDFAHVAVTQRRNALLNPKAMMRAPITVEDHQNSPWIIEPFRLLDCCLQTDGAVALVITSIERAHDTRHSGVPIVGVVGGSSPAYRPLWEINAPKAAAWLYQQAGITVDDIDFAELYDPFTGMCLMHIEGFGLTGPGEAGAWVRDGQSGLDGSVPVNTHGGLLSEGHVSGYNHVVEAVQQLRPHGVADDVCQGEHDYDRAHCRQVKDARVGLVCGENGESALLLRRA